MISILEAPGGASEAQVTNFEQEIGHLLPSTYRVFLLSYNGGYPEPDVFPIADFHRDTHGLLDRFFGLGIGTTSDLARNRRLFVGSERVPPDYLPIARDPGGNLLCIAIAGPRRGEIWFWDHEGEPDEDASSTEENLFLVARDFGALLNSLVNLEGK